LCFWLIIKGLTARYGGTTQFPWDASWYHVIVQYGYSFNGNFRDYSNIAFAPLYPLICRMLVLLLHVDSGTAMYVVTGAFFLMAIYYLYLVLTAITDRRIAFAATLIYATNPFSFFLRVSNVKACEDGRDKQAGPYFEKIQDCRRETYKGNIAESCRTGCGDGTASSRAGGLRGLCRTFR
jgi:hypothetical protein